MIPDITPPKRLQIPGVLEVLNADAGTYRPFPLISQAAKKAVFNRDMACCKFCGELAGEYHQVLGYGGPDRDLDSLVNTCAFCWQCFDLEGIRERRSADLVHCPEIDQARLNRTAMQVRLLEIKSGMYPEMSKHIDTALAERARHASDRLGQADLLLQPFETIRQTLRDAASTDPEFVSGLRLWPTRRWNDKEGTVKFNRFPQMLTNWRSERSEYGSPHNTLDDPDSPFLHALRLFVPEAARRYDASKSGSLLKPIANFELASKLLRDAATFFETIGSLHAALARQMAENAEIFKQVADLNEVKPMAHVGDDPKNSTNAALAAKLLRDAAEYFEAMGFQNPPLREQMEENANVFRQVADLVEQAPEGIIEG